MMTHSDHTFSVVWKYIIKPEHRAIFEKHYGYQGSWYQLFANSPDYRGSYLHQNTENHDCYLLIDTWKDEASYEEFKQTHRDAYYSMSSKLEYLYEEEVKIGSFSAI